MLNIKLFKEAFSISGNVTSVREAYNGDGDYELQYKMRCVWHPIREADFISTLKTWASKKGLDISKEEELDEIIFQCENVFK